ncbi:MAG: electron transport complex subunit RsxC, partial [Shewanella sp.]
KPSAPLSPEDEKKAKVAAAVARAKAKKAAAQQAESTDVAEVQPKLEADAKPESTNESDDGAANKSSLDAEPNAPLSPEDEKKAKVAAAVARAKAKKLAREAGASSDANE